MRNVLRWLPAREHIEYRIAAFVWRCLLGLAPAYLFELCGPLSSARRTTPSVQLNSLLQVLFARTFTRRKRDFSVVGLPIWNGLPSLSRTPFQAFLSQLKMVFFGRARVGIASEYPPL